ncbi:DUF3298 domain-containing protein [Peptoclostridium sp. AF21-18]|uniref:DUF3298 domain-containing protein n=1 Tax=Peptoclostridium sp. AF21-18 TaxID=2292243 RepID=UPI000E522933|nr:DUF3298 domain-containing protein [Peptoclostridium sp. AF21-18]RHQ95214.1 DUF3298 domain-containing protein [Peptoclostridium sp. AF21-18]
MKNDKIDKLKENYNNIEIPKELDDVINDAFNESENKKLENNKKDWRRNMKNMKKWYASAAAVGLIIVSVNASSTFAKSLENIPVIGNIIRVVNFNNYRIDKDGMDVSISLPEVSSDSKDLEYKLNKEFEKEGKEAYKKYEAEVEKLEKEGKTTHKSAEMWSETVAENDKTLSVAIYNTETEASASTSRKIYNIDKKDKTILTLEGMFGNNDYVDVLSKNILSQMKERTKKDSNDVYFVDNTFKIKKDQPFYINDKGELVICFDEYEVAPGSAGLVEFVIPSNIVSKLMK